MYKYFEPSKEELEIENAFKKGKVVYDKIDNSEMSKLRMIAKNTLNKTKSISIRVTLKTLFGLRSKAIEEGIPYQTLAGSILHKSVSNYS